MKRRYHCALQIKFPLVLPQFSPCSAYELYADPKSDIPSVTRVGSSGMAGKMSMAQRFKETFSYEHVRVHFVGAWYVMAIQNALTLIEKSQGYCFVYRGYAW